MRIFQDLHELPSFKNPVVTLGTFDGVHKGHQAILRFLKEKAQQVGGETILITFWPHPRMVLQPQQPISLLNTLEEKIELLSQFGLDNLIIIPFTKDFAALSYSEFIEQIIADKLKAKVLAVGHDHQFGRNREGSFEQLQALAPQYNFEAIQLPAQQADGVTISSTKIRNALLEGNLDAANKYLGYPYSVTGEIVHGEKIGRTLGFPTANVDIKNTLKLIPANGIYVTQIELRGRVYNSVSNIGNRPTFNGTDTTLEVNIFDFEDEIYGEKMTVFFLAYLRNELKFANIQELIRHMNADKRQALAFFSTLKQ